MARKIPRFLTPIEVAELFLVSEKSQRDSILLKCLYFLGLKNAEAQSLLIRDIDVNKGMVTVRGRKDRSVPIPLGFAEELARFLGNRNGLLFEGRANGKLSDRHIRRIVKEWAIKAGVQEAGEVHPHTLRHSYAMHLQNAGVPLGIIQNILGHERIKTTALYTKTDPDKAREWIEHTFTKKE